MISEAFLKCSEFISSKTKKFIIRTAIIGLLENGCSKSAVSSYIGCHPCTVTRWEKRDCITDQPRSGRPLVYEKEKQLRLIAFYCQSSPLATCGRWSLALAAEVLNADLERIGFAPSKSTIHRILQGHHLKPHRSKYFLHISDPDFFPKMERIIELYLNPPKNLFSFDECPGIQVLQRLVPDMRTEETKIRLEEYEYIRNGTIDLFACFDVNTGKVFSECYACHKTEQLAIFMEKHFRSIKKDEPIDYILDNLNTHCSYVICSLVAKYSDVECPSKEELNTMKKRREWLSETGRRIVFHFTPFHGSWLNMVEVWFGIMSGKCLKESFSSPEDMYEAINAFTDLWNTYMAHPFNWKYTGEGLHEKVVQRLIKNFQSEAFLKIELRVLTKQLCLMNNLYTHYRRFVSDKYWNELRNSFQLNVADLIKIIKEEKGLKRRQNAQTALQKLQSLWTEDKVEEDCVA